MNSCNLTRYEQDSESSDDNNAISSDDEIESYRKSVKMIIADFERDMNACIDNFIRKQVQMIESEINLVEFNKNQVCLKRDFSVANRRMKRVKRLKKDYFYDSDLDESDEEWISKKRVACRKLNQDSQSDAVLNCPCCFSLLCMDCQRHEFYKHQYRAMFALNCMINENEFLIYNKNRASHDEYKVVYCKICYTKVAVYEHKKEIYHFFHVLAGY